MPSRLSKTALVAAVALFMSLVAFGNVTDYGSNFAFVQHVLSMDDTFKSPTLMWRAITTPALHHAAYAAIIAWEALTAMVLWIGALRLWAARGRDAAAFAQAKGVAIVGLTMGFLLWVTGFITVGGEWFAMWQSKTWNGQGAAHVFLTFTGIALLHLSQEDAA